VVAVQRLVSPPWWTGVGARSLGEWRRVMGLACGRWRNGLLCIVLVTITGCRGNEPAAPPSHGSVSGRVALVGVLFDEYGRSLGERTVTTADSVFVVVRRGPVVLGSTRTAGGFFRLESVPLGRCFISAGLDTSQSASSVSLYLAEATFTLAAPIVIRPMNTPRTYPNPFACYPGITVAVGELPRGEYLLSAYYLSGRVLGSGPTYTASGSDATGGCYWRAGCWGGGAYNFRRGAYWIVIDGLTGSTGDRARWLNLVFSE
jgi:hypothetical protein